MDLLPFRAGRGSVDRYDLVVIGSGPAGEKGATQAAYFGKRVALVERSSVPGGACINTGTIPSKSLRESALYYSGLRQRGLYGIDYSLREGLSVRDFMHRKDVVVELERMKVAENLAAHDVDVFQGTAEFVDPQTVAVRNADGPERLLRGEYILIATGSRPHRPHEIPFDDKFIFDSDSILQMDRIPQSLVPRRPMAPDLVLGHAGDEGDPPPHPLSEPDADAGPQVAIHCSRFPADHRSGGRRRRLDHGTPL